MLEVAEIDEVLRALLLAVDRVEAQHGARQRLGQRADRPDLGAAGRVVGDEELLELSDLLFDRFAHRLDALLHGVRAAVHADFAEGERAEGRRDVVPAARLHEIREVLQQRDVREDAVAVRLLKLGALRRELVFVA